MNQKDIQYFWSLKNFKPNPKQEKAILHTKGPLFEAIRGEREK